MTVVENVDNCISCSCSVSVMCWSVSLPLSLSAFLCLRYVCLSLFLCLSLPFSVCGMSVSLPLSLCAFLCLWYDCLSLFLCFSLPFSLMLPLSFCVPSFSTAIYHQHRFQKNIQQHIKAYISYASVVWDGCGEVHFKKLNSLHCRASKLILPDPSLLECKR